MNVNNHLENKMQEYKPPQTLNDIVNFIKGKKDIKSKKNNLAQNDIEHIKNDQIPKVGMLFEGIMLDGVPPALIKIRREEFKTLPRYEGIVLRILNMAFRDTSEKKLLDHRQ